MSNLPASTPASALPDPIYLKRYKIVNYRAIAHRDDPVPEGGIVYSGGNGRGKSTTLNALGALFLGKDIKPDAIRIGTNFSEIMADMNAFTATRSISPSGASLTVRRKDGIEVKKPQTWLNEVFGQQLNPLDLLKKDKRERRQALLEAMPITVRREQLTEIAPDLPATFDVSGHALEVIARAHDHYYDLRKAANLKAADEAETAKRADDVAISARIGIPENAHPFRDDATKALDAARKVVAKHEATISAAEAQRVKTETARLAVVAARKAAEVARDGKMPMFDGVPIADREAALRDIVIHKRGEVAALEKALAAMKAELLVEENRLRALLTAKAANDKLEADAVRQEQAAAAAEKALAEAAIVMPDPAEVQHARVLQAQAEDRLKLADRVTMSIKLDGAAKEAHEKADNLKAEAQRLDVVVKAFANDLPRKLVATAGSGAFKDLRLEGDDIFIGSVRFDALSGREKIVFAVDVAKRLSGGRAVKLLLVDEIEKIDLDEYEAFVDEATKDGWQLIATRVTRGEIVVEGISRAEIGGEVIVLKELPDSTKAPEPAKKAKKAPAKAVVEDF